MVERSKLVSRSDRSGLLQMLGVIAKETKKDKKSSKTSNKRQSKDKGNGK